MTYTIRPCIGARKHLLSREIDLDTHIQDIIGSSRTRDLSDIVLVGHSYGGMVITGVADRVHGRGDAAAPRGRNGFLLWAQKCD
ncbi:MAG: alpha/beta hydrolase [Alphaproteobacteria bacterium]|nr:alpha/beta hydrolase [Alphaproteobacteria bacterium]